LSKAGASSCRGKRKRQNCLISLQAPGGTRVAALKTVSKSHRGAMKKITLLAVAFVFVWLAMAQAQVSLDPYPRKDETNGGGHHRTNPDGNPSTNWLYPYTGRQATGDQNRHLERFNNQNNPASGGYGNGPTYNPYTIYRR
jgi:hypothetical protein